MSAIAPVVYHQLEMLGQVIAITNRSIILFFLVQLIIVNRLTSLKLISLVNR